jgi:1,4-dihydroxy-2-naphthoyl-CoA hydrolase
MLWKMEPQLDLINASMDNTIGSTLGIQFTKFTDQSLTATMPVDARTHQPYGILHGGASVVLAETIGSIASHLVLGEGDRMGVGQEVNANHLRPVADGYITGVCTPLHIGQKTHVWDIKMYEKRGKLNCVCRLTVAIVPK